MSSLLGNYAQSNRALYINVTGINSTIFADSNNTTDGLVRAPWVNLFVLALSTPGQTVLRDMGKTVYLPGPEIVDSNSSSAAGYISSVFRKVQYIPPDTTGTGSADGINYYTGYIRLGGVTYGGGTGVPTGVARLC